MMEGDELYEHNDSLSYLLNKRLGLALRYGLSFLFLLGIVVFGVLYFVKVPDTLEGRFVLSSSNPPKTMVAKVNGRIVEKRLQDKDKVTKGQVLLVLENLANLGEIETLETQVEQVQQYLDAGYFEKLGRIDHGALTQLGEMQSQYEQFKKANNELYMAVSNGEYRQEKVILQKRLENLQAEYQNLMKQKQIYEKEIQMSDEAYAADSILNSEHSITRPELRNAESNRLQGQLSMINLQQSVLRNRSSITDISQQMLNLERSFEQQKNTFVQVFYALKSTLKDWKSTYLVVAPFAGTASFNRNIYEGMQVSTGDALLYIVPQGSELVCETLVPQPNFGKIKKDQRCVIKFDSYNFEEYGVVEGYVFNISDIPQEVNEPSGIRNYYMTQVALSNGVNTSYNKQLNVRFGLTGTINIVLDDKNLLEKLFLDKLRSLWTYQ